MKLLTNYGKLKNHPNIQGWLIRTLENQLNNEKSRAYHSREIALEETYVPAAEDPFEPGFSEVLPSELGERERELLYLHVEVGLPHREIAKYLGCSTEACRMRLSRAKEHCQRVMKKFSG